MNLRDNASEIAEVLLYAFGSDPSDPVLREHINTFPDILIQHCETCDLDPGEVDLLECLLTWRALHEQDCLVAHQIYGSTLGGAERLNEIENEADFEALTPREKYAYIILLTHLEIHRLQEAQDGLFALLEGLANAAEQEQEDEFPMPDLPFQMGDEIPPQ